MTLALFLLLGLGSAHGRVFFEQDAVAPHPAEWSHLGRANAEEKISLIFAVKQTNLDKLEQVFDAVSDPRNDKYGQHLSLDEVNALVAPTAEAVGVITSFLSQFDLTTIESTGNNDMIKVICPISVAEQILETEYHEYNHSIATYSVVRSAHYSLPQSVARFVDFVSPTTRFPTIRPKYAADTTSPDLGVTPDSLRTRYKIGKVEGKAAKNKQSMTAFLGQYYSPSDLQTFYKDMYPAGTGRKLAKVVGPNTPSRPGIEANLDVQYMTAIGGNVPSEFWSFKGRAPDNPENEPFLTWLYLVANTTDAEVPYVFSTSYGEDETSTTMSYATRINAEFQKAGARGISILFASGDSGVGGTGGSCTKFVPQWPSGSPYVTAVGGTTGNGEETGAGLSSGGFSNRWDSPKWQTDAVKTFFSTSTQLPEASRYNKTGRGFPDVSAKATGFRIVNNGRTTSVAGTSCSSPTFGGVVGLLNDLRVAKGKSTLGFLNPLLYQNPQAFIDITAGNNPGCGTKGFYAVKGWDAVTGNGSPNYEALAKVVEALP